MVMEYLLSERGAYANNQALGIVLPLIPAARCAVRLRAGDSPT
jgi:hypothetical protein